MLKQESARFEGKTRIQAMTARVDNYYQLIATNILLQASDLEALSAQHDAGRVTLRKEIERVGMAYASMFRTEKMLSQAIQAENLITRLSQRGDADLNTIVQGLYELGKDHTGLVADFGITATSLDAFKMTGNTFADSLGHIELPRDARVRATARIAELMNESRIFLRKELDPAIEALFMNTDPEFLELYRKAREVHYRTRHRQENELPVNTAIVTFVFTNAGTGEPIEGVAIALNGIVSPELSDENGEIYLDTLIPGTYHIAASAPGYQPLEWDTPQLEAGNEYDIEKALNPEANG